MPLGLIPGMNYEQKAIALEEGAGSNGPLQQMAL